MDGNTLVMIVVRIADALKRNGYQSTRFNARLLTAQIVREFEVARISDMTEEQVAELKMYLDCWIPTAKQRFIMRDTKLVQHFYHTPLGGKQ